MNPISQASLLSHHSAAQRRAGYPSAYQRALGQALKKALAPADDLDYLADELMQLGQPRQVRARKPVFQAGERDANLWLLVSGKVALGKHDAQGRWWQSREFGPGDWIDLLSAWVREPHAETAIALTEVQAHALPVEVVALLCDTLPGLARALLRCVAAGARGVTLDRQALLTKDIHSRLAAWLLEQSRQAGDTDELQLQLQKKDLASQLGVTPETLSRSLRALHDQGIARVDRYQLSITNRPALQALADRQPSRYSR
ncbi:Crp/Fnr family transcriptional regulator [Paucibacter soli]|uniref:Crp/Fnr family transcriptional regulator n=1 Tax=Paucibacter soli TaxID=3133433 RepID=UPI0030AEC789